MRPSLRAIALAGLGLASTWGILRAGKVDAQEQAKVAKSARGGLLARVEHHQFEVFFFPTGVRVFAQDHSGATLDATKLGATATFYHPNSPQPWFARPLRGTSESLDLAIGLGNAPRSGAKVTFQVSALPGGESVATFTVPLDFVPQPASQPSAPPAATTPSPRYVYVPGYHGYGYYAYPGPETMPQPAASSPRYYGSSGSMSGHTVGPMHRDWATGRDLPLAKPWMKPRD